MIDTLLKQQSNFKKPQIWDTLKLSRGSYIVMTLHRPANVDKETTLEEIINLIIKHTHDLPVIFPVHPRTAKILSQLRINHPQLYIIEPLSYLEFNYLVERTKAVITDSGDITEEASILGVPCLILRDHTERPETIFLGTNELIGTDPKNLKQYLQILFDGKWKKGHDITLWDGNDTMRIMQCIKNI